MKLVFGGGVGATFVVVMLNGCVGDDPSSTPSTDGGSSSSSGVSSSGGSSGTTGDSGPPDLDPDAAPPALCPLGCLPPAPAEWIGPSAVYDGAESTKPADCPTPYTVKEVDTHHVMTAAPATCDCGTVVISGRKCTAPVTTYEDANCTKVGFAEPNADSTGCVQTLTGVNAYFKVGAPTLAAGSCTYPNAKTTLPPITYEKVQLSCGLPQAAACAARPDCVASPTPEQPFTRLCIHHDGDVSCPSADYAVKLLSHKKVDDKRACTTCVAGAVTGGACGTSWGVDDTAAQCTALNSPSDKTVNGCYVYPGKDTRVDFRSAAPSAGTCPAQTGGVPSGAATSLEPVTFCCNR